MSRFLLLFFFGFSFALNPPHAHAAGPGGTAPAAKYSPMFLQPAPTTAVTDPANLIWIDSEQVNLSEKGKVRSFRLKEGGKVTWHEFFDQYRLNLGPGSDNEMDKDPEGTSAISEVTALEVAMNEIYDWEADPENNLPPKGLLVISSKGYQFTKEGFFRQVYRFVTSSQKPFDSHTVDIDVKTGEVVKIFTTDFLQITTSSPLPNGTVGIAYSTTLAASNGAAPYTWSIPSGTLPAGLSLGSSGSITGTPLIASGPTTITFKVTDSLGGSAIKDLSITIVAAPAITTSSPLPNGTVGIAYSTTLAASNGAAPYTWSILSGTLPAGLSLGSSGSITGTPFVAGGPTTITFKVTDSLGGSAIKYLSITIVPAKA